MTAIMDDSASASTPQVRSRITVVCAECKRLKLKCDRRTPCGSCVKRETVARCIYSQAAAEKVDLQSMNNRLIQVEAHLAMLTNGKTTPPFQSSYPLSQVPLTTTSHPATAQTSHAAVFNPTSPISIRTPDLINIWLAHCQLDLSTRGEQDVLMSEIPLDDHVKQEPTVLQLPSSYNDNPIIIDDGPSTSMDTTSTIRRDLPPLYLYHAAAAQSRGATHLSHMAYPTEYNATQVNFTPNHRFPAPGQPSATPAIFSHLPPPPVCTRLLASARSANPHLPLLIHWTRVSELADPAVAAAREGKERQKSIANAIFFKARAGSRSPSPPPAPSNTSAISLPLFACMCYLLALGALEQASDASVDHPFLYALAGQAISVWEEFTSSTNAAEAQSTGHGSVDASKAKQENEKEDLDHVVALLLQVKYLLRAGSPSSSKNSSVAVFPLVGKLVNTARGLGLARDPEEVGVRRNVKADERRRVIWWDIMFYDTFTSDVLEHTPILSPYLYTTRVPGIAQIVPSTCLADVVDVSNKHNDEDLLDRHLVSAKFNVHPKGRIPSRLIPPPYPKAKTKSRGQDDSETGFFGVRCRLTRLAQSLKYRLASPGCDSCSCGSGYTLDQAAKLESEIRTWVSDLPDSLHLETPPPSSPSLAIAAELAVLANRMIIAAYVPLMRPSNGPASSNTYSAAQPWSPSCRATVDAAQGVVRAARVLNRLTQAGTRASFMGGLYPLQKAVADALVICAHSGFVATKPGRSVVLIEEVSVALELLCAIGSPEGEMSRLLASLTKRIEGTVSKNAEGNTLKRKHDVLEVPQHTEQDVNVSEQRHSSPPPQQPQLHPTIPPPHNLESVSRSNADGKKGVKKGYPAVGFRDRGKDNAPWMAKKTSSSGKSGGTQNRHSESRAGDIVPPPIHDLRSQQVLGMDNDRSRSSSIAPHPQGVDYSTQYVEENDVDMHTSQRRRLDVNDVGLLQQQQYSEPAQQPFVPPSTYYIPSRQSSCASSFEVPRCQNQRRGSFDQGSISSDGVYGSPSSPLSTSSVPLSAGGSPYGVTSGHQQTPVAYSAASHNPNPLAVVPQPPTSSPPGYYPISSGYDYATQGAQQQHQLGAMDTSLTMQSQVCEAMVAQNTVASTPIFEKSQQQVMYNVKSPVELMHHQQMHHYQVANGHTTPADQMLTNVSVPQGWAPTPQYMQPHRPLVEPQEEQYWTTGGQSYY
ncbi:hypothetical protein C0991_001422 [Blastosporella zonata]|nr:hypothetical protein C0991_001422 [Blastosporella zonata]